MNDRKIDHPTVIALLRQMASEHDVPLNPLRHTVREGMRAARFELNMAEIEELAIFHINTIKPTERKVGEYRNRLIRQADRNRYKTRRTRDYDERSQDMA